MAQEKARWRYQECGREFGPVSKSRLVRFASEGKILRRTLVRHGLGNWTAAEKFSFLSVAIEDHEISIDPTQSNGTGDFHESDFVDYESESAETPKRLTDGFDKPSVEKVDPVRGEADQFIVDAKRWFAAAWIVARWLALLPGSLLAGIATDFVMTMLMTPINALYFTVLDILFYRIMGGFFAGFGITIAGFVIAPTKDKTVLACLMGGIGLFYSGSLTTLGLQEWSLRMLLHCAAVGVGAIVGAYHILESDD